MNLKRLRSFFDDNTGNQIHKWDHYFDVYERYFCCFLDRPIVLLEIGVNQGGSLEMWRNYFHPDSIIIGVDINPQCKIFEKDNIFIEIGSQDDPLFWNFVMQKYSNFDIIIDDGGHVMKQQIVSFVELFPRLNNGGIYLCEDTHTSYWIKFGGNIKGNRTFIGFAKNLVDDLHGFHLKNPRYYTSHISFVHFFDSIVVIGKEQRNKPFSISSGLPKLSVDEFNLLMPRNSILSEFKILVYRFFKYFKK